MTSKSYVTPHLLDKQSSKSIANVTAAVAGREKSVAVWKAAREQAGKLEILLTHIKNLGRERCATPLDERLAALRTKRHLSGTSAQIEVSQRLNNSEEPSEIYWRSDGDIRQANRAQIHLREPKHFFSYFNFKVCEKMFKRI